MKDALNRFKSMDLPQIQNLALEIAMLGNKGLNINDPAKKYPIQAWAGAYSGLHLISIMFAAFQQFAPDTDVGIDLSKEYRMAFQSPLNAAEQLGHLNSIISAHIQFDDATKTSTSNSKGLCPSTAKRLESASRKRCSHAALVHLDFRERSRRTLLS